MTGPVFILLTPSLARVTLTRRVDIRSLRLVEEAMEELERAAALIRQILEEERARHRRRGKHE